MKKILFLSLLLLPLYACQSLRPLQDAPAPSIEIHLTHIGGQDFQVRYEASRPVKRLTFSHQGKLFRQSTFQPEEENLVISAGDGKEFLVRKDGGFFREANIRFRPYIGEMPQEYKFSIVFSDSSVAFYTAHLLAEPDDSKYALTTFHFNPTPAENLIFDAKVFHGPHSWQPSTSPAKTYVYFGSISPSITGSLTTISDPAVPLWVRQTSSRYVGKLFRFYEAKLAFRPDPLPSLIVTTAKFDKKQDSFGGSSGTGWIHLGLIGGNWLESSEKRKERLLYFIAHEGFHQFQGPAGPNFMDVAWLIEGSAEFFADWSMKELGWINKNRLREKITESANRCARLLESHPTPLSPLDPKADFRLTYACGRLVHEVSEAKLRKVGGFAELWKRLLAASNGRQSADKKFIDASLYFTGLKQAGASDAMVQELKHFVFERPTDPVKSISSLLRLAGWKFRIEADPKDKQRLVFVSM